MKTFRSRCVLVLVCALTLSGNAWADAAPVQFWLGRIKVQATPPPGWSAMRGVLGFADTTGKDGYIQMTATAVNAASADAMNKAAFDQAQARMKTGELARAATVGVSGVNGLLTIDGDRSPSRRMEWTTVAAGHSITFTMGSSRDSFVGYLPLFHSFLLSIRWL